MYLSARKLRRHNRLHAYSYIYTEVRTKIKIYIKIPRSVWGRTGVRMLGTVLIVANLTGIGARGAPGTLRYEHEQSEVERVRFGRAKRVESQRAGPRWALAGRAGER